MANKQDLIAKKVAEATELTKKIQQQLLTLYSQQFQNTFQKVKKFN